MIRSYRCVAATLAIALSATLASAQFNSAVVGFNDSPLGDPAQSQEMFLVPEASGTTSLPDQTYIVRNDTGLFNQNSAFRASGLQSEGAAALQFTFRWVDPADPNAWVRLTTFNGARIPNPSLHTAGKVRFNITNRSELFFGEIGLVLGIRETGVLAPQLGDGGTNGALEWVGVDETPNGIIAGADGIVDTVASGDDVQAVPFGTDIVANSLPSGTAVIEPGNNGVIDTVPAGDDEIRFGYFIDTNGNRRPVPAVTLPTSGTAVAVEFDLATGDVTVGGVTTAAGVAAFTGNGILDATDSRGTLEHLAVTNVAADVATLIEFGIDELQFESPAADPIFAPSVGFPIIAGDTSITVNDIQAAVNQIQLLRNGAVVATQNLTPPAASSFEFTGLAAAVAGDEYTATQRSSQNNAVSAQSEPSTVFPEPPVLAVSMLMDESGSGSSSFAAPGWEWVGVSAFSSGADPNTGTTAWNPEGVTPLFLNDAIWQVVEIPLDNDDLIIASLGGNGALGESPTGAYTMDTVWFNLLDANQPTPGNIPDASWEVLIDAIELVGPGDVVTQRLIDNEDGTARFGIPRGQTHDDGVNEFLASGLFNSGSYDGGTSHRGEFRFDGAFFENFSMLQRIGNAAATAEDIDDETTAIRFHMVLRGARTEPNIPLPVVDPVLGLPTDIVISHDAAATSIELFINGASAGSKAPDSATSTTFSSVVLALGDSISAKQTIGGTASDFAYPRAASALSPPVVTGPIDTGSTQVSLSNVNAAADSVTVYADNVQVGTASASGSDTIVVTTSALADGAVITATQTVNTAESIQSLPVTVFTPAPTVSFGLLAGDTSVTVSDVLSNATNVTVFANDVQIGTTNPAGSTTVNVSTSALSAGDVITATQTVLGAVSPLSDPRFVGDPTVPVPVITSPICVGDHIIEISNIDPNSSNLTIFDGSLNVVTSFVPAGTPTQRIFFNPSVSLGETFTATQTVGNPSNVAAVVTVTSCDIEDFCLEVFSDNLDTDTSASYTVLSTADTAITFAYDYSNDFIPPAPNGPATTIGIKAEANIVNPTGAEIAIVTLNGINPQVDFTMEFDFWINFSSTFSGTTEFIGGGVGHDGVTADLNGASFVGTGEGGSVRDYRMYKDTSEQFIASGQYSVTTQNATDPDMITTFPVATSPVGQQTSVSTAAGELAFEWRRFVVIVDVDQQTVKFSIDGLEFGTLACGGENGDTCNVQGALQLIYRDLFSSVSPEPQFQFGIFDNIVVTEDANCNPFIKGDVNCSGSVDAFDIEPFILALLDPNQYANDFPACDLSTADINGVGGVNSFDIEPFISCVLNAGCP